MASHQELRVHMKGREKYRSDSSDSKEKEGPGARETEAGLGIGCW